MPETDRHDIALEDLDRAYLDAVLGEAREALGGVSQRIDVRIAPIVVGHKPLSTKPRTVDLENTPAMHLSWIARDKPAELRVDPLALRVLGRPALRLGLVHELARIPYERALYGIGAVSGPIAAAGIFCAFWFGGISTILLIVAAITAVAFVLAPAVVRWSIYRGDKRAMRACSESVETFKEIATFNEWAAGESGAKPSRVPWWLDFQPSTASRLRRLGR